MKRYVNVGLTVAFLILAVDTSCYAGQPWGLQNYDGLCCFADASMQCLARINGLGNFIYIPTSTQSFNAATYKGNKDKINAKTKELSFFNNWQKLLGFFKNKQSIFNVGRLTSSIRNIADTYTPLYNEVLKFNSEIIGTEFKKKNQYIQYVPDPAYAPFVTLLNKPIKEVEDMVTKKIDALKEEKQKIESEQKALKETLTQKLLLEFKKVLTKIPTSITSSSSSFTPSEFMKLMRLKFFEGGSATEEDPQEFISGMMNNIEANLAPEKINDFSKLITMNLHPYNNSQEEPLVYEGKAVEPSPILPISLWQEESALNFQILFNDFFKTELLDTGVSKYYKITQAPGYLIIQLKRFDATGAKIETSISDFETLTIGQKLFDVASATDVSYELIGTINHEGSTPQAGHYIAHVKTDDNVWYQCNDNRVTKTEFGEVPQDPYMLLYKKIDDPLQQSILSLKYSFFLLHQSLEVFKEELKKIAPQQEEAIDI